MKIKIIKVPTGQAPQEVRDLWLGCVLEVYGLNKDGVVEIQGQAGLNENSFGYVITRNECIRELRKLNRHLAARFWEITLEKDQAIVFGRQFCEQY